MSSTVSRTIPLWAKLATAIALLAPAILAHADDYGFNGTEWRGTRASQDKQQNWSLKITERKGNKVKGEITLVFPKGEQTVAFTGEIPQSGRGNAKFSTEKKGEFSQQFEGKIGDGILTLSYSGTGFNGKEVSGTGSLRSAERVRFDDSIGMSDRLRRYTSESTRLSPAALEKRIVENPRKTEEEKSRYAIDMVLLKEKTGTAKLPSVVAREERERAEVAAREYREAQERQQQLEEERRREEQRKLDEFRRRRDRDR